MGIGIGSNITGRITRIERERVCVSLPTGQTGIIRRSGAPDKAIEFQIGHEIDVRIVGQDRAGTFALTIRSTQVSPINPDRFEKSATKLNNILNHHHVGNDCIHKTTNGQLLLEQRLGEWIEKVDTGLGSVRKHRSKRLSQGFYGNK